MTGSDEADRAAGLRALIGVKFAMAHAEIDDALADATAAEVLTFVPLAAATGVAELPDEIAASDDDSVVVGVANTAEGLTLQVSALGFVRAQELAGRRALLRAGAGLIAFEFRFDATGYGEVRLADGSEIRRALLDGWSILIGR